MSMFFAVAEQDPALREALKVTAGKTVRDDLVRDVIPFIGNASQVGKKDEIKVVGPRHRSQVAICFGVRELH